MGRCSYDLLKNIEPALVEIRKLEKVKEPKPGIFYVKSQGFLHFHSKDDKIWADIKSGADWGAPYDIPAKVTPAFLNAFVKEVKKRHAECL